MNKKIVITGANGFIGCQLSEFLAKQGHEIYALVRHLYKAPPPNITYRAFDLHSFSSDVIPEGTDVLIHAAYIPYKKGSNAEDINFKATKRLIYFARRKGVKQVIFLSSFSAKEDAISKYGKSKFATTQLFDLEQDLVLEPGLVLGKGGLFAQIQRIIKHNKFIPLIGNGVQEVQTIWINDLIDIISQSIDKQIVGNYCIAEANAQSMKKLYKHIAKAQGKKIRFIRIPYWFSDIVFYWIDKINFNIGVSNENYLGLKLMQSKSTCDAKKIFGIEVKTMEESVLLIG